MFTGINLYVIIGLLVTIGLLGGSFYAYKLYSDAEQSRLIANNATLTANVDKLNNAVETNEKTIAVQAAIQAQVQTTSDALSKSLAQAEADSFARTSKIKDQDIVTSALTDPAALEKEINDDYDTSNKDLTTATSPVVIGPVKPK